jgi:V-type H+-transporting ATPase subunit d
LYPRCGKLYPEGLNGLARADDYDHVKQVCEFYSEYKALFEGSGFNPGEKTLEDKFFEYEVGFNLRLICNI